MQRILRVETDPPGALVFVDGKRIGESPVEIPFDHFGTREVMAEKDGFARRVIEVPIEGSWYEAFPFDFFTEFLPLYPRTDRRLVSLRLPPAPRRLSEDVDPEKEAAAAQTLIQRAESIRRWAPGQPAPNKKP